MSQVRLIIALAAIPFALWLFVPVVSNGQQLQRKIEQKRQEIESEEEARARPHRHDRGLFAPHRRARARHHDPADAPGHDRGRSRPQARGADEIQRDLRSERARITRLRARLVEARAALSERLVYLFKADEPDVVTVVLESEGFADLLQRTSFMQRVSQQDARIIDRARDAKADAEAAEKRLDRSEARQREVTAIVARRREEVAAIKGRLVERSSQYRDVRSDKREALVATRADRKELEGHLVALEKEEARVRARLAGNVAPGPIRRGSGVDDLADQRRVHVAVRDALGTPARRRRPGRARRDADPRRRVGQRGPRRLDRRVRQLHVHRARRLALDVLRPPVAIRHVRGRQASPRARSSATSGTPGTRSARTCISRRASTGRPSTRWTSSSSEHSNPGVCGIVLDRA